MPVWGQHSGGQRRGDDQHDVERGVVTGEDPPAKVVIDLLLDKLKKTRNNVEFLMQIQKTTLGPGND